MHCSHAHPYRHTGDGSTWHTPRYRPWILPGTVALLGLGTHHWLLVAFGLLAVLAFRYKLQQVGTSPRYTIVEKLARADGGSFPGARLEAETRHKSAPIVIDGGSMERGGKSDK